MGIYSHFMWVIQIFSTEDNYAQVGIYHYSGASSFSKDFLHPRDSNSTHYSRNIKHIPFKQTKEKNYRLCTCVFSEL